MNSEKIIYNVGLSNGARFEIDLSLYNLLKLLIEGGDEKTKYLSFLIDDKNINSEREITVKTKDITLVEKVSKKVGKENDR